MLSYRDTSCSCMHPNECLINLRRQKESAAQYAQGTTKKAASKNDDQLLEPMIHENVSKEKPAKRRKTQPEKSQFDNILEEMKPCTTFEMLQVKSEEIKKQLQPHDHSI